MYLFFLALALIPAAIIFYFLFRADHIDSAHKKLLWRTTFYGAAGVPFVIVIHFLLKELFGLNINIYATDYLEKVVEFPSYWELFKNFFMGGLMFQLFLSLSLMAGIEEYAKHWVVKHVDWNDKSFNRIIDGVEFSIASAVGFSVVENMVFFFMIKDLFLDINMIIPALVLRSVLGTVGHSMFSGIFGYYYGRAKFVGHTRPMHATHERKLWNFHIGHALKVRWHRLTHFFRNKNLHETFVDHFHQDELIAEGLLIATFLHGVYNFALAIGLGFLVVPLLVLEYLFISHEFHIQKNLEVQK